MQTFHLSSGEMAPRPPRAYFSTLWSHKSLEKHSVSRLSYLFTHLHLLSSDFLFSDLHFSALLFSDSSHRRFLRQSHIVTIIITHIAYIYNIYIYRIYHIYIYISMHNNCITTPSFYCPYSLIVLQNRNTLSTGAVRLHHGVDAPRWPKASD